MKFVLIGTPLCVILLFQLQSECLKEAFSELDMTSEVLEILMSPDKPYFRLSTFGNAGSTHVSKQALSVISLFIRTSYYNGMCPCRCFCIYYFYIIAFQSDFPKECDMVESFQCTQTQTNR